MKTKILITLFALFAFSQTSFAQKVKIKKGIAYVDKKPFVKAERESGSMSVYPLNSDDEIIYIKYQDPTPDNNRNHDSYYIVRFIDYDKEVEISYKSRKAILKMLFKSKVIDESGTINEVKMKKFLSKYGSDLSKR